MFATSRLIGILSVGPLLSLFAVSTTPLFANETEPLPKFVEVEEAVKAHFAEIEGYRENDLLNRKQVTPLFAKLETIGFAVPDKDDILKAVLPETNFIVRRLSTKRGTKFMRRISGLPEGYDRLERLSKMPYGPRRVRELIRGPDGYTMIKYMTTTKGGRNLGRYLSRTKTGKNFNKKTGRIYTEKQLVTRLRESYNGEYRRRHGKDAPLEETSEEKKSTPGAVGVGRTD